jgi:two-component system, OmpR family, response regulator
VARSLKQAGYAVDHASDGEAGLALAESTNYEAPIVDVMLPKLNSISQRIIKFPSPFYLG